MADTRQFARKVRRSLLQRELLGGVPQAGLIGLFVMTVLCVYLFKMYFMLAPIAVSYFIMRRLTAQDPWMIEIVLANIQHKDVFIP